MLPQHFQGTMGPGCAGTAPCVVQGVRISCPKLQRIHPKGGFGEHLQVWGPTSASWHFGEQPELGVLCSTPLHPPSHTQGWGTETRKVFVKPGSADDICFILQSCSELRAACPARIRHALMPPTGIRAVLHGCLSSHLNEK